MTGLISVHLPKTAGTSLARLYETEFGEASVWNYYADDPVNPCAAVNIHPLRYRQTRPLTIEPYRVVHGHFHVGRFALVKDVARSVVLRHPIENLISIYYYWDQLRREGRPNEHCLFHYFCTHHLGLLDLATIPAFRFLMSRTFFGKVDMGCFDVIGDFSNIESYVKKVSFCLGVQLAADIPQENITPISSERALSSIDRKTQARISDLLYDDLKFYGKHCRR